MSLIPSTDRDVLASNTQFAHELVDRLHLSLFDRLPIAAFLITNPPEIGQSRTNQVFATLLSLQSFASLYFVDLSELSGDAISTFVSSLALVDRLSPESSDIACRSFDYFYFRLSFAPNVADLIGPSDEFFASRAKVPPKYFVPTFISVTINVLRSCRGEAAAAHLRVGARFLGGHPLHAPARPDAVLSCYGQLSEIILGGGEAMAALAFGIELFRVTSIPFPELRSLIEKIIDRPLFGAATSLLSPYTGTGKLGEKLDIVVDESGFEPPDVRPFREVLDDPAMLELVEVVSSLSVGARVQLSGRLCQGALTLNLLVVILEVPIDKAADKIIFPSELF
jgi:hypothetical protein